MKKKENYFIINLIVSLVISLIVFIVAVSLNKKEKIITKTEIQPIYIYNYFSGLKLNEAVLFGGNFEDTIKFFNQYTNDSDISTAILKASLKNDVPICLSFAVCWAESRFNPKAYRKNTNGSIDRGLFQLNDSYRNWPVKEFYDVYKNSNEGVAYLKKMINRFYGNKIKALLAYNFGLTRVLKGQISSTSLDYIYQILKLESIYEYELNKYLANLREVK